MAYQEIVSAHRAMIGRVIWHYDALESTNDTAKEVLEEDVPEGLVIWADRQASGRGRHGRAWASPLGGLYFSVVLRPKEAQAHVLGLFMGMPLIKTFRHFGVLAGLKWPNDAVFQERKIAGVLSEGVYRRDTYHVIVGIGANTNVDLDQLPPDLRLKATTLKREVPLFVSHDEFLDYFFKEAELLYSRYRNTPVEILMKDYRGQCITIGKRVSVTTQKGIVVGRGHDLTSQGALVVLDDAGVRHEIGDGTVEHLK